MLMFGMYFFMKGTVLVVLGVAIGIAPLLLKCVQSRSIKGLFFWRNYENITTYSDGRKTSDGGFESGMLQLFIYAVLGGLLVLVLSILMPVRILIMGVKYYLAYRKVQTKPDFLHSGFFLIIVGFLVFIGAPILSQKIPNPARIAMRAEQNRSDYTQAEIRTMLDKAKADFLSSSVNYTVDVNGYGNIKIDGYGEYKAEVRYRPGNEPTTVNIPLGEKESPVQGWYSFSGITFVEFDANGYHDQQPAAADIEAVKAMLPQILIFPAMAEAKDSDLWAKNQSETMVRLEIFHNDSDKLVRCTLNKTGDTWEINDMSPNHSVPIRFSYSR
jgi:hypothetical protein